MTKTEFRTMDAWLRHRAMHGEDWEFDEWQTWHQNHDGTVSTGSLYVKLIEQAEVERAVFRAYVHRPTDTPGAAELTRLQREICREQHAKHLGFAAALRPPLP